MATELFRKSALDKMSSPEELDRTMNVMKNSWWLVIVAFFIIFTAVLIWSITGTIPDKVASTGVLIDSTNFQKVNYSSTGIVKNIFIETNSVVKAGQIIAKIERTDLSDQMELAKVRVNNIQAQYDELVSFTKKDSTVTSEILNVNERNLIIQIKNIKKQEKEYQEKFNSMKELYDQGIINGNDFMNAQNNLYQTQRDRQSLEKQLLDVSSTRIKNNSSDSKNLMQLQQQLEQAKLELSLKQNEFQKESFVTSVFDGVVTEVPISVGDYINQNSTIAYIKSNYTGQKIVARTYYPNVEAKRIKKGMEVAIIPSIIKKEEFGYMYGIVTDISEYPVSIEYLTTSIKNNALVQKFSKIDSPIEVVVALVPDPYTKTGYKWSSSKGPNETIETGVICSSEVTVKTRHPIQLVLPTIKKKLFGIGE